MSKKSWIIFAVILVAFGGLLFAYNNSSKIDLKDVDVSKVIEKNDQNGQIEEHLYGNKDAKIVLIEYGDYQCAGCASMSKKMKTLSEEYTDKVAFVFRNYTMDGHPNSLSAAAAVESASLQGKFWEMHDLIYENQSDWANAGVDERNDLYTSYATELKLDEAKFKEDMKSEKVRKKIEFDKATAKEAKLDATPFFVLNGEKVDTDIWGDDEKFRAKINEVLKQNNVEIPKKKSEDKE